MIEAIQVTVATNSKENATSIAETLVNSRLAASVWVSGPIFSTYWWQGEIHHAEEWVCTAKTRRELYNEIEQAIMSIHPYEVPGILALPAVEGSQSYLEWIMHETKVNTDHTSKPVSQKIQLIQKLGEAHERLIEVATLAHERGIVQKDGKWGPREVIGHIAGWEAKAVECTPKIIAGEPHIKYGDDVMNAIFIEMLGDQPFKAVRDILRREYQRDMDMLKAQDDKVFIPGHYVYERIQAAIQHVYDHTRELEEMIESIIPSTEVKV